MSIRQGNNIIADKAVASAYSEGEGIDITNNVISNAQATSSTLGGIKASEKTSAETQEVKIDSSTGKLYVQPGGSTITTDDITINYNADDEIQTIAVIDQNNTSNGIKTWTGTETQYKEIGYYFAYNYSSTTVYVRKVTPTTSSTVYSTVGTTSALTISSVGTSSITLSDGNTYTRLSTSDTVDSTQYSATTLYNVTDDSNVALSVLETLYPVGALYFGTMATCPLAVLGIGTWQLVASDKVIQGAGTRGSVGTTIDESLPNITGKMTNNCGEAGTDTGALYHSDQTGNAWWQGSISVLRSNSINFDASLSSSTYQDDAPVQQDAYVVNIWERIS